MSDRRGAVRFLVRSPAPGLARVFHDVIVERVAAGLATIISTTPVRVGEQLLLNVTAEDGQLTAREARVQSTVPVYGGRPGRFRIELQLSDAEPVPTP